MSQPSLTQAIHSLEEELGGTLFLRGRGGARLTELGKLVESNFRSIYETSLQTKEQVIRFRRLKKEPLKVGILQSIGAGRLSPFFAKYQKQSPALELEVVLDKEAALSEKLWAGELDYLIHSRPKKLEKGLQFVSLYEESYVVALPPKHALVAKESLSLQELSREPYLDRLHCEMRETLREKLGLEGIKLYAAYRSNREEWLMEMVREGLGFAIVPEHSIRDASGIVKKELKEPKLSREIGLVKKHSRRGKHDFVRELLSYFEK